MNIEKVNIEQPLHEHHGPVWPTDVWPAKLAHNIYLMLNTRRFPTHNLYGLNYIGYKLVYRF